MLGLIQKIKSPTVCACDVLQHSISEVQYSSRMLFTKESDYNEYIG